MPPASSERDRCQLRQLGLAALLLALTVAAYWPALNGEFLLDDQEHVTRPELRSLPGLARIWWEVGATQQYYPVVHTAFWLEHRLWGDAVFGYHLANVLLHAVAAGLVVAIMRRLRLPGAWLGGFIFALHPLGVESVAWIAEQKNTLSTVFYLGAALVYLEFDEQRARSRYVLASALFALALASKTATATLPAALLVIFWWQRSRVQWRRDVRPLLPWFGAAAIAGVITLAVERKLILGIAADISLTWLERCLLAGRVFWFYLLKLLWPVNLTFIYERWPVNSAVGWQYLFPFALLAVAVGLACLARRTRGPLAAFLLFGGTLFPVLGFVDVEWFVFSFVADHLQYLASLGIIVPVAAGLSGRIQKLLPALPRMAPLLGAALLAVLGALTWRQSRVFRDNVSLYGHAVAQNPGSPLAHNHLGVALARIPGRRQEAISEFEAALRLNPDAAEVHENLGVELLAIPEQLPAAIRHLEAALRIKPGLTTVHATLGRALLKDSTRLADAVGHFRAALRRDPENADLYAQLGNALAQIPDRLPEAVAEYEIALRLKPDSAGAHFDLGKALAATGGRTADAIQHYESALRLDPNFAEAHYNLGNALLAFSSRRSEAISHFEAALRARPDFAAAHANLGVALASTSGRLREAIAHFEAALRADPGFTLARNNLSKARQLLAETEGTHDDHPKKR